MAIIDIALVPGSAKRIKDIIAGGMWRREKWGIGVEILRSTRAKDEVLVFARTPLRGYGTKLQWVEVYRGPEKWLKILARTLPAALELMEMRDEQQQ